MLSFAHSGALIRYDVFGEGPVIAFGHGLGGDSHQVHELLGDIPGWRLVVWDARAHGLTEYNGSVTDLSFSTFADDLKALLDHLSIRIATIGGVSMGAGVAVAFASRWPDRAAGLILIRPAWLNRGNTANLRLFPVVGEALEARTPAGRNCLERSPEFQQLRQSAPDAAASLWQQFDKPWAMERRHRLVTLPASAPIDAWSQINSFAKPALVIGCRGDPIHPFEYAEEWARQIGGARLAEVPPKAQGVREHNRAVRRQVGGFLTWAAMQPGLGNPSWPS